MSVDRLDAILRPMNFTGSKRRSRALVFCAWLFACLMASPLLVISQEWPIGGIKQCWINLPQHWHWRLYVCLLAAVLYVCPAIIITICYMVIVITIWSKGALTAETQQLPMRIFKKTVKNDILVSTPIAQRRTENMYEFLQTSSRGLIPKAKIKTIKMTLVIVLAFVFCWSPFFLFDLLDVFGHIPMSQRKVAIAIFIQSLAPLNSAANPIIYCLFNTRLCNRISRMKIVQLLCCKWKHGDMIPGTPENGACQYSSRFSMAQRESRTSTTRDPGGARNNSSTVTRPASIRAHAHNNATFFSNGDKTFSDGL